MIISNVETLTYYSNKVNNGNYLFKNTSDYNNIKRVNDTLINMISFFNDRNTININDMNNDYVYINIDDITENMIELNLENKYNFSDKINSINSLFKYFESTENVSDDIMRLLNIIKKEFLYLNYLYSSSNNIRYNNKYLFTKKYIYIKNILLKYDSRISFMFFDNKENKITEDTYLNSEINDVTLQVYSGSPVIYSEYIDKLKINTIKKFLNQGLKNKYVYYYNKGIVNNIDDLYFGNIIVSDVDLDNVDNIKYYDNVIDKKVLLRIEIPSYMNTMYDLVIDLDYFKVNSDGVLKIAEYNEIVEKFSIRIYNYNNNRILVCDNYNKMIQLNNKLLDIIKSSNDIFDENLVSSYEKLLNNFSNNVLKTNSLKVLPIFDYTKSHVDSILKASDDYNRIYTS